MVLPAVCTITKATRTSPLLVPAGSPMFRDEPPTPLVPGDVDRSEIPPPGGGVGVAVGVGVGVGAGAGLSAISCVTLELALVSVPRIRPVGPLEAEISCDISEVVKELLTL